MRCVVFGHAQAADHLIERPLELTVVLPGRDEQGIDHVVVPQLAGEDRHALFCSRRGGSSREDERQSGGAVDHWSRCSNVRKVDEGAAMLMSPISLSG